MQQTSIDEFFKNRKRPASELLSNKTITRKLFAQDDGPSSPLKSPIRRVLVKEIINDKSSSKVSRPNNIEDQSEKIISNSETKNGSDSLPSTPGRCSNEETCAEESSTNGSEAATTPVRSSTEQEQLQKELSLGEFKKIVRQSKKFSTLKAKLEKFNATSSNLKTSSYASNDLLNSPELKRFSNVEFEINSSPMKCGNLKPRKLFAHDTTASPSKNQLYVSPRKLLDEGPVTSPVKPASDRFKHLTADAKDLLVLPPKYAALRDIFNGIETVVRILLDRKEVITFKRIRSDVQKMIRRNFTEKHLGMIKSIYPDAYELEYKKIKLPMAREETWELIIEKSTPRVSNLTERKKLFDKLLLERTKLHHQEFLKTLDPPLDVPINQVMRWHPLFDLCNVPDIESTLPQRPVSSEEAFSSPKAILEKTRQLMSCNKRMERAVTQLISGKTKEESDKKTESSKELTPVSSPISNPIPAFQKALKGVPKSLLEKIRAKKAAKMVEAITQTPEKAKEQAMLSRLPELAKIMRIIFVNEKKGILPEELVLIKVSDSFKEKLPTGELVEHLKLISKHVPGWLNFCTVRNVSYVRLSKDADMSRVLGRLQKLAQAS